MGDATFEPRNPEQSGFLRSDSRGVAGFDFDRDGDIDLLVADADGEYQLYENDASSRSALQVAVPGRDDVPALGATVTVVSDEHTVRETAHATTDFLSQDSRVLHFGFPAHGQVDLVIRWSDGTERTFEDVSTGQRLTVSPAGIENRDWFGGPTNATE